MQLKGTIAVKILAGTLFGLFALWFTACLFLFCFNSPGSPAPRVDAVIVLGGSSEERLPVAQSFAADAGEPVLVVSWTDTPGNVSADNFCRGTSFPSSSLICFRPVGMDTRGEAEVIGKLVKANGWTSIAVVTSSYHLPRSGTLIQQCTDAKVNMVASKPDLDSFQWLRRFVIETGGLIDVNLHPECTPKSQ
ncbi:YdcF family protein [Arthrobacter sp. R4]|uniref:YdcF family protein n=1 Tax=Arthrobacter sp. R4 TaxID=644417 RepID=UPI003EDB1006